MAERFPEFSAVVNTKNFPNTCNGYDEGKKLNKNASLTLPRRRKKIFFYDSIK